MIKNLLVAFSLFFSLHIQAQQIQVEQAEAQAAFNLLNQIRAHPEQFEQALGITSIELVSRKPLVWNNKLAKVALDRVKDMAKRNYFDHINPNGIGPNFYINREGYSLNPAWLTKKEANNFESIAANWPSAIEAIQGLIIGKNSPGFMHRKHLLGMDEWNGSLQDIGIAYIRVPAGSQYKSYLCVIIAKHDW